MRTVTLASLLVAAGCAQPNPAADPSIRADAVLDAAIAAAGGLAAIDAPEQLVREDDVRLFIGSDQVLRGRARLTVRGENERLDLEVSGGRTLIQIVTADAAREWDDGREIIRDIQPDVERRRTTRRVLREFAEADRVVVVGREEVGDDERDATVLEAALRSGESWRIWITDDDARVARVLCAVGEGRQRTVFEEWWFDYEPRGTRWVPTRVVLLRDGVLIKESALREWQEGAAIDAACFEPPPATGS